MLTRILEWSLHHRLIVIAAWIGVVVAGVLARFACHSTRFANDPAGADQHGGPRAGAAGDRRQITTPIEWSISGLPALHEVRSVSRFGFSQVTVTFGEQTDIYLARQVVSERLNGVELPPGIERPRLGPVATGLGEVFHYLVTGAGVSQASLRTAQDWIIKPQLRSVAGVAEVVSWGGDERQVQVVIDPTQLQRYDLSLAELAGAIEANNGNAGGGTLDRAGESSLIHGIGIAPSRCRRDGRGLARGVPVRVRDVARVVDGRELRRGAVTADGKGEAVLGLGSC